jgi:hypothetical protein
MGNLGGYNALLVDGRIWEFEGFQYEHECCPSHQYTLLKVSHWLFLMTGTRTRGLLLSLSHSRGVLLTLMTAIALITVFFLTGKAHYKPRGLGKQLGVDMNFVSTKPVYKPCNTLQGLVPLLCIAC